MKLDSVPSLQTLGQKLPEADHVIYFSYMFKGSKTLGEGIPRDNYHTKALGIST